MPTPRRLFALVAIVLSASAPAFAGDAGVKGKKLVIKRTTSGRDSIVLMLAKDAGIQKGDGVARGEVPGLSGYFEIYYTNEPSSVRGAFTMPEPWAKNRSKGASFFNKGAPIGGGVFNTTVKNGKLARVDARSFGDGDTVFDFDAELPSETGGITTVLAVLNEVDGTLYRMCTRFAVADGSSIERKTTNKATTLTAKKGVASDCPPLVAGPAECEMLNGVECLLPYPSSHFLTQASSPTGYAMRIPQVGAPQPNGPVVPTSMFDALDGFSPGSQILMHFPQGVDVARYGRRTAGQGLQVREWAVMLTILSGPRDAADCVHVAPRRNAVDG